MIRRGFLRLLGLAIAAAAVPVAAKAAPASPWKLIELWEKDFPAWHQPAQVGVAGTFRHQQTGEMIRHAVRWNNYTGEGPERQAKRLRARRWLQDWADGLDARRAREAVERFDEILEGHEHRL